MISFARQKQNVILLFLCILAAGTNTAHGCSIRGPLEGEEPPDITSVAYLEQKAAEASSIFRCELVSIVAEQQATDQKPNQDQDQDQNQRPAFPPRDDINANQLVTCNVVEKWKGRGVAVGRPFVISTTYGHLCGLAETFVGNEGQEFLIYSSGSGKYERVSQGTYYDLTGDVTSWEDVSKAELGVLNSLGGDGGDEGLGTGGGDGGDVFCSQDVRDCGGDVFVSRDPANGCQFRPCPEPEIACAADVFECPGGDTFVSRDPANGCQFRPCPKPVACPADAFQCPNGTFVSRDPANDCKFRPCPQQSTPTQSPTFAASSSPSATPTSPPGLEAITLSAEKFNRGAECGAFDAILDIRSLEEWEAGHVKGATHLKATDAREMMESMEGCMQCRVAIVGSNNGMLDETTSTMLDAGFERIYNGGNVTYMKEMGSLSSTSMESVMPKCVAAGSAVCTPQVSRIFCPVKLKQLSNPIEILGIDQLAILIPQEDADDGEYCTMLSKFRVEAASLAVDGVLPSISLAKKFRKKAKKLMKQRDCDSVQGGE